VSGLEHKLLAVLAAHVSSVLSACTAHCGKEGNTGPVHEFDSCFSREFWSPGYPECDLQMRW
jgi:hypothetical protein